MGLVVWVTGLNTNGTVESITTTKFIDQLEDGKIDSFSIKPKGNVYEVAGEYKDPQEPTKNEDSDSDSNIFQLPGYNQKVTKFTSFVLSNDSTVKQVTELADQTDTTLKSGEEDSDWVWNLVSSFLPMIILIILFYVMFMQSAGGAGGRGGSGGGSGGMMSFGRSKAKPADPRSNKIRFQDVAGAEEEKQELVELVEFLRTPKKFTSLGARIPKGFLLEGPPGTGKTLLAKAVAGEASVPFYSISGSDFVEMFVGVGASRVRDLFENAKKTAPSIIFIDEIDAVGRRRGAGTGGGNDEREQTLNQILIEMDGFSGNEGVIVLASTNRSDVLDPALLRSGRFDRKILIGAPDVKGREAILNVHSKNKPLASDVDLKEVAQQTPGFVGADLENLLNESALLAARRDKSKIDSFDLDEAEDRVIAGPAKKDRAMSKKEREKVAYHEAGHAVIGMVLDDAQVVRKVTIVPRGRMGGYALMMPREEEKLMTVSDAKDELAGLMAGRAAEVMIFGEGSTGASNDFQKATDLSRRMVTEYGMSEKLGMVQYEGNASVLSGEAPNQGEFSQQTAELIDNEVKTLTDEAYKKATTILKKHAKQHKAIAMALLEYETLDEEQIESLFKTGKMPKEKKVSSKLAEPSSYEDSKKSLEDRDKELAERFAKGLKEPAKKKTTTRTKKPATETDDNQSK